jgi:hypothetical protein
MRLACMGLLLALLGFGCRSGGIPADNIDGASRDQASADLSRTNLSDLASVQPDFSGTDLSGRMCFSSGTCTKPDCGTSCCTQGEWCDNGTCRCGDSVACTDGNTCVTATISVGNNSCGDICCGATSACPG